MFKRYEDVILRLEELGTKVGRLNNSEREELQKLLEEQVWLSETVVKKAKSILEEIDKSFERLFDWMIYHSDLIERATGESGTPEDILQLEKMMGEAIKLRDQMRQLKLDKSVLETSKKLEVINKNETPFKKVHFEAAPTVAVPVKVEHEVQSSVQETVKKPAKKKLRKKKVNTGDIILAEKYAPPKELLNILAQKMTPQSKGKIVEIPNDKVDANSFKNSLNLYWPDK